MDVSVTRPSTARLRRRGRDPVGALAWSAALVTVGAAVALVVGGLSWTTVGVAAGAATVAIRSGLRAHASGHRLAVVPAAVATIVSVGLVLAGILLLLDHVRV